MWTEIVCLMLLVLVLHSHPLYASYEFQNTAFGKTFFPKSDSWMAIIPCGSTWVARCGQPRLTLTSRVTNKCTSLQW